MGRTQQNLQSCRRPGRVTVLAAVRIRLILASMSNYRVPALRMITPEDVKRVCAPRKHPVKMVLRNNSITLAAAQFGASAAY